jgi:hypothetical protein
MTERLFSLVSSYFRLLLLLVKLAGLNSDFFSLQDRARRCMANNGGHFESEADPAIHQDDDQ